MATVKVIPARNKEQRILRVAAYCRVSSDSADQQHSYAAQVLYYTPGLKWTKLYQNRELTGSFPFRSQIFGNSSFFVV